MSRYRQHWEVRGHYEVAEELEKALAAFGVQNAAAEGEFTASLKHLKTFGTHPEELAPWGPYRCFPTVVWPDAVLYVIFRDVDLFIVVLHVTRIVVQRFSGQLIGPRPKLPQAAWKLAKVRYEAGPW